MSLSFTSNSEILRFLRRLSLFAIPLLLIAAFFEWILWNSGETLSYKKYWELSIKNQSVLIGRKFISQDFGVAKFEGIKVKRPEIVVLGSSRVMQFRDFMFNPFKEKFFNAGGIIQNIYDLDEYTNLIDSKILSKPSLIIIGLDPWWLFSSTTTEDTWLKSQYLKDAALSLAGHVNASRLMIKNKCIPFDYITTNINRKTRLFQYEPYGLTAIENLNGFRYDGSRYYGNYIQDYISNPIFIDRETPSIIERVKNKSHQFTNQSGLSMDKLEIFQNCVRYFKSQDIEIAIFIPPYSSEVYNYLENHSSQYLWWDDYKHLIQRMRENDVVCNNISCPEMYKLDDRYMYDGFHPGEVYVGYILKDMIKMSKPKSILSTLNVDYSNKGFKLTGYSIPLIVQQPDNIELPAL